VLLSPPMSSIENLRGKKCKAKYLDGQYYQATIVAVLQEFDGNLKYRVKWENYDEESHCYDIRSISSDDEDGKQEEDDDAEEKEQLIHGVRATAISEKEKQDHFPDPSHPAPSPPLPLLGHPSEHDSAREYVNPERLRRVPLDIRRRRNNTFGAAAGDSGGSGEEYVKNGSRVSSSRQNNRRCSNYNEQSSKGKIHDSSEQSNKSGNVGYGGAANYFSDIRTTGKQGGGRGNDRFSVENEHRTHHKMGPYQHNHSRSHHHQHYHHQLQKQQQVGKTPSNENHRNSNNPYFQNNDNIKHDKGRRRWGSGGFQNHHYYHQNQHHHHERRNNGKQHAHRNQNEAKSWSYSSSERLNEIKTGNYQKKTRSVGDNVNQLKRGDDDVQIDIDQVYKSDVFFTQLNGLRKEVKRALMEDRITSCSLVQARCLPSILEWKKDGICQAPSGTGKTTMLCIALINSVDTSKNYCQALCTVPVRELATQIHQKVLRLGRFITPQMKASLLVPMSSCLLSHCHIAVGTNGKTRDICIEKKKIDISKLRVHVIDEADKLLDCSVSQEFNQRTQTLELMHYTRTSFYQGYDQKQNPPPQLVMFLATLPKMLRKNLTQHLTEGYFQETVLRESHLVMPNIKHFFVTHDGDFDRYKALGS